MSVEGRRQAAAELNCGVTAVASCTSLPTCWSSSLTLMMGAEEEAFAPQARCLLLAVPSASCRGFGMLV